MSEISEAIPGFLKQAKADLAEVLRSPDRRVTFVTGNQSADLDSACSAILYAYFSSTSSPHTSSPPYIPLVHIPREDLDIRPEFIRIFDRLNIAPSSIVTLSDLPDPTDIEARLPPERTNWILVDHNKLEGRLAQPYGNRVSGVIDHHKDEDAVPHTANPRRIEVCGSCASLVLDHFRYSWLEAAQPKLPKAASVGVAQLGLAAMLIDTRNLTNESKVRPVDEKSVAWCEALLQGPAGMPDWDREAFFHDLDQAKKDIEGLSLDGILRKDYKEWEEAGMRLGISSVVKPLHFVAGKSEHDWAKAAHAFMNPRKLDIWAIMTGAVDPASKEFGREIYIQWTGEKSRVAIEQFEKDATDELNLKPKVINGIDASHYKIWQQGDTTQTRKQVGPLLREAMRKV